MDKFFYKLNNDYKELQKHYDMENILGIFLLEDKETTIAVVIPSFEEVCLSHKDISHCIVLKGHSIVVKDIRTLSNATKEGSPELIQGLNNEYRILNPSYEDIVINMLDANEEKIKSGIKYGVPAKELELGIVKIMRAAFNNDSNVVRFLKALTPADKSGLNAIRAAVGVEGEFSQAKLASEAGISRAAMTNLIQKIKDSGVAEVEYRGVKGTYIKLIDVTLLNMEETFHVKKF